jgi:hypothetical protein
MQHMFYWLVWLLGRQTQHLAVSTMHVMQQGRQVQELKAG